MYETAAAVPAVCEHVWPHLCVCVAHTAALVVILPRPPPFWGLDWSPALNVSSGAAADVPDLKKGLREREPGSVGLVCETVSLLFFSFTAGLHL